MNRFLLLLTGSLLAASATHAQVGLRAGASLCSLHTTDGTNVHNDAGSKAGYQAGITYQVPLSKWLAVVPEVQYSNERMTLAQASYATSDIGFVADYRLSLHYLNVPVLVRATLGPVYLELGPQASLLLGGRQTGTLTTTSWGFGPLVSTADVNQDVTENNRRFDVGPCAGVGVQLPAGLGLSVRAYRGLVTLNHERSLFEGEQQRQTVQASLTYQLPARQ